MIRIIRSLLFYIRSIPKERRKELTLILGFIASLPFLSVDIGGNPSISKTLFVVCLMSIYWVTEVIPIPVTALFPLFMFPFFQILEADQVSSAYFNDTIFLFMGSFVVAFAMERWNLHRRIALKLLMAVGNRPKALLLGFMIVTAFLSMWMSNSSTTSIMAPLVMSTLLQLRDKEKQDDHEHSSLLVQKGSDYTLKQEATNTEHKTIELEEISKEETRASPNTKANLLIGDDPVTRYSKATLIAVAYSASIGGTSTIIGTGPNLVFKSQMRILFPYAPEISFFEWSLFAFPLALFMLIFIWLGLCNFYIRNTSEVNFDLVVFSEQYKKLGPVKFAEKVVIIDLTILALMWFSRVGFGESAPGWYALFGEKPGDGTVAMMMAVVLFLIPSKSDDERKRVMDWEALRDLPWGVLLLLGGGFAIAKAFSVSGLSLFVGESLKSLFFFPKILLVFCITAIIIFATELTSNVATANIVLPILAAIAVQLGTNPLLLMVPATIACSYAFMFPVATPPNAIVFASGFLTVADMAKIGIFVNLLGIILLPSWMFLAGTYIFGISMNEPPTWAQ